MQGENFVPFGSFQQGLYALADTTKAPWGSARVMRNMMITDRLGVGPRPGTSLLGTSNASSLGCRGFFNYKRSFESDEILVKVYDTFMEGYSKNYAAQGWFKIKSTMTSDKDTGFVAALLNTDNNDQLIIGNRYDPFQTWTGALAKLNGALVGGETTIVVDTTLTDQIYQTRTATANSATTLDIGSADWAASQWIGLYVYITSGAYSGQIRLISSGTSTQITFATLGGAPGNCTFQIRQIRFPASGTLQIGSNTLAYSAIPSATQITTSAAPATADATIITPATVLYPQNPRGSRFANFLGRMVVVNVRSALALNSGGTQQGFVEGGNFYVSKFANPFDYSYSATRVAGEGDFQPTPYGGGDIIDVVAQEEFFYVFKRDYIESVQYSQDTKDTIFRVPLKAGIGSIGRVIPGPDDVYFITPDKQFTSIGRAKLKDLKPHTENIGLPIKRLLDTYDFAEQNGVYFKNRVLIFCKSSATVTHNDIMLVYNRTSGAFEGIWDIPAMGAAIWQNNRLFYAEAATANVYEMFVGNSDVNGTDRFAIDSEYATHFFNVSYTRRNKFKNRVGEMQQCHGYYFEGYIKGNSTITFQAWKDFAENPFISFDFNGTETAFEDASVDNAFLGGAPIGLNPMGALGPLLTDGRRHFSFRVFFPFQYGSYFSVGFKSGGSDIDYEVTNIGLAMAPTSDLDTNRIKSV